MSFSFIIDIVAFLLAVLAALEVQAPKVNLGWLALALFILGTLVH